MELDVVKLQEVIFNVLTGYKVYNDRYNIEYQYICDKSAEDLSNKIIFEYLKRKQYE